MVIRVEAVTVCLAFEPYNVVRTIPSPSSLILHPLGCTELVLASDIRALKDMSSRNSLAQGRAVRAVTGHVVGLGEPRGSLCGVQRLWQELTCVLRPEE